MLKKLYASYLKHYSEEDYIIRQKAIVLLTVYIAVFFLFLVIIAVNFQELIFDIWIFIPLVAGIATVLVMIFIMYHGYFSIAAHFTVILAMAGGWLTMFLEKGDLVRRTDTIAVVMGLLAVITIAVTRHRWQIVLYFLINIAILFLFGWFIHTSLEVDTQLTIEFLGDTVAGMSIFAVFSYQFFSINTKALQRAKTEIEKNNELNRTLEKKVEERTSELQGAMEEIEAINDYLTESNKSLQNAQRIMQRDMDMAVNVQRKFFPDRAPSVREWEVAFYFKPMSGVSGDFFDFYVDEDMLSGVAIFDVSGHGIASGLITMIAKSILFRNFHNNGHEPLNKMLEKANKEIIEEIGKTDNFISGILLKLNEDIVEYSNAGHTDLILRKGSKQQAVKVLPEDGEEYKGFYMGVELMDQPFPLHRFKVEKNDTLLLFTDCLIEGKNSQNIEFGLENVLRTFTASEGDNSAQEQLYEIIQAFNNFTNNQYNDDLTAIVLRRLV